MSNKIIAGKYKGSPISYMANKKCYFIQAGIFKSITISNETVESFNDLTEGQDLKGTALKGAIGAAIAGPIGMAVGIGRGGHLHRIELNWQDGEYSIIEFDDKTYYLFRDSLR